MRLHFQEKPWDLYAGLAYTIGMAGVLLGFGVGNFLAILGLLFIPGYVIAAALFPGREEIDWIERIALSVALSVAITPLLGLLLNFTPFGIRFVPVVATLTLFTVAVGSAAHLRRMRLPPEQRLSFTLQLGRVRWQDYTLLEKAASVALGASIAVAGGALIYVVQTPRPTGNFTEFYVLGPGGNASGYPTRLNISQAGAVIVGIVNHESASIDYTVRVDLVGVGFIYNATSGYNETRELNRTTLSWINVTLGNDQTWTYVYTFSIDSAGSWKLELLLHKNRVLTGQELHLFIRVS